MHSSGQTIILSAGGYRAKIVSVGAGLAELIYQGAHLVIPHNPEEMPLAHLGKVLIPWPNRVSNGCYHYQGHEYQLPINEHHSSASIHGLLAWRDWQISELTPTKVSLVIFLPPSYGYPFSLLSQVNYCLDEENGLSVEIISKNIGQHPAPYGIGVHPYLTCNMASVDGYQLYVPARQVYAVDIHNNPTHLLTTNELNLDYSTPRIIGDKSIDHTFKVNSLPWEMKIIDHPQKLSVSLSSDQPWLQIYTGEKLNRQGLAIEPMSCPPNAFNSGVDLVLLNSESQHRMLFNIKGEHY